MKQPFHTVVDRQRIAQHRLHQETWGETDLAHYRRSLRAVPLADVSLPRLPLVRASDDPAIYVLLGEVAQMPGKVVLLNFTNGAINLSYEVDQLLLVPPDEAEAG